MYNGISNLVILEFDMLKCLFFFFFISNKFDFFQLFDAIKMGCELVICGSLGGTAPPPIRLWV